MILLYHASDIVKSILEELCVSYRIVEENRLCETLGSLFQITAESSATKKDYHIEFDAMIFHETDDNTIQCITKCLKAADADIARKAVLTKHNQNWRLGDLLLEIDKDHRYFQERARIMELLNHALQLSCENYAPSLWNRYQQAFIHAYEIMQTNTEDSEVLKKAADALQGAEKALYLKK